MVGKYTTVDLFCGAGGLSLGFKNASYEGSSFKIVAAVDNWKPAVNTYKANHPEVKVIPWDIREKRALDELVSITGGHVDTVIGGPPCEAFSLAGKRDPNDPRARLFYEYIKIVERLKPYMFVMENVKGILTMITLREDISQDEKQTALKVLNELLDLKSVGRKRRAAPQYVLRNNKVEDPELQKKVDYVKSMITTVPEAIKQAFNNVGYDVAWRPMNAADYGVPQERERVFFIGTRRGFDIKIHFPEPTHSKEPKVEPTGRRLERWRTLRDAIGDLPPFEERVDDEIYNGGFSYIYMSRNRVMSWDKPSYTILASARHILLHPDSPPMIKVGRDERVFANSDKKPRRLSIRECARIQTFPDSYKFVGNTVIDKYALIGDAVPPLLARRVAESVVQSLVEAKVKPSE
jgi:DNA (cytosine-5)-methyltransferase 1